MRFCPGNPGVLRTQRCSLDLDGALQQRLRSKNVSLRP
jgi:hypothetical protein